MNNVQSGSGNDSDTSSATNMCQQIVTLPLTDQQKIEAMTVSVQPMREQSPNITDGVKTQAVNTIFKKNVTKGQRINTSMKTMDPNWDKLKYKV